MHLPLGSIPILLGIRPEVELDAKMDLTAANKAAKEKHTFSLSVTPIFDKTFHTVAYKPALLARTLSSWVTAQPCLPQSWKEDRGVKDWKDAIEAASTT